MDFNAEQTIALQSSARNLLVLAGAGTGKTRTIIGRAQYLLNQDCDPRRLVIVTFTRRAATEIRGRLIREVGQAASHVVTGTFHNFCLRIMSSRRRWFGFDDLTVMDRDDQLQLMRLVRSDVAGKDSSMPQASQLLQYYSYARNTNQQPREYLIKYAELEGSGLERVLKVFDGYKQRKLANSYFDYDDILHRFAKVMHDDEEVRRKVASAYSHVLVDEMQDTNPLQWLILESLADHASLFCVGDDAQSIYAFRGADFKNVHSFDKRLDNAQTLKLKMNYRSTQPILDLANWILDQSSLKYDKRLESVRGEGDKPQLLDFDSEYDEAEWIVGSIVDRHAEGGRWDDNMILCRSAYVARPVEAELIEQKIPYRFVGGVGLLQMAHVRDLLSVMRVAVNHRDELAWMRYLMLWPRVGEVTAARALAMIVQAGSSADSVEALAKSFPSRPEIVKVVAEAQQRVDDPAAAVKCLTEALEPLLENKYDRWDNRKKDFELLQRLAARHRTISGFLETYTLDPISASEANPGDDQNDIVTLITVHSAKGTEAKTCFVIGVQPGNFPHSRCLEDPEQIEEERRVLYVAATRAQDELILTRNLSRGYSRISFNSSANSQYFLERLPGKLVDAEFVTQAPFRPFNYDDDVIGRRNS